MALNLVRRNLDETLYAYLERRERELLNQIAAEKAETATKETELAHVQSAKRQIGNFGADDKARFGVPDIVPQAISAHEIASQVGLLSTVISKETEPTPIKQLIMKAMWAAFRERGATSAELRQFIQDAYGRDIPASSISPQLSRLKSDALIKNKEGDIWRLTKLGTAYCSEAWGYPTVAPGVPPPPY